MTPNQIHGASGVDERVSGTVSILDLVGNTPLIKLEHLTEGFQHVEVLAKAEYMNPAGSVKDRAALNMIRRGIDEGLLTPGKIILDSTSGNTGIAYAMIGAVMGFKVKLVMPGNVSPERRAIVKMYGAETILSSAFEGSDGAILKAREIYEENPDLYFKPDQYNNDANPEAHYLGTGPEIWRQTEGRVTHFLATLGTSGTLMGTSRFLKEVNSDIKIIAVEPDNPMHGIEGLKHMATSIKPGIYSEEAWDEKVPAFTEDAYDMQALLAEKEGLFVGFSAGAAVHAALELAKKLEEAGETATVVTILCDRGDRYLSQLATMNLCFDETETGAGTWVPAPVSFQEAAYVRYRTAFGRAFKEHHSSRPNREISFLEQTSIWELAGRCFSWLALELLTKEFHGST